MTIRNQLIKGTERIHGCQPILFCFPYAGGGASAYNKWQEKFGEDICVCPVQLPGREERIMEKHYTDMGELIADLISRIRLYADHPIYLFGHSMGAKIACETARRLEEENCSVSGMVLSASKPPFIPPTKLISHLPDKEFIDELVKFNGIPQVLLDNREALNFFIPMLRNDFVMDEAYDELRQYKLKCPIIAIGGSEDSEAEYQHIVEWKRYTDNKFLCHVFSGGHFYIWDHEDEVIGMIKRLIDEVENGEKEK